MTKIKFCILGTPRPKKNNMQLVMRGRRPALIPSKKFLEYKKLWAKNFPEKIDPPMFSVPVEIKCSYFMDSRRRVDLTNLLEATDDLLVDYGLLSDDSSKIIVSHDGSRVYYDKEAPRVEIEIKEYVFKEGDENLLL